MITEQEKELNLTYNASTKDIAYGKYKTQGFVATHVYIKGK